METLLSGNKLNDELEFFKRHLDIVAAQKVKHPATYVPPLQHRPKRATLANVSCASLFRLCVAGFDAKD